jgi:hypothetical protein
MGLRLIFLDIDGVLNSSVHLEFKALSMPDESIFLSLDPAASINQENLNLLHILVDKTQSQIVISSTWRKDRYFVDPHASEAIKIEKFKDLFAQKGWINAPIIGTTPVLSGFRGQEVATFLDDFSRHHRIDDYLIFDDDSDYIFNPDNLPEYRYDSLGFTQHPKGSRPYWENQRLIQINKLVGLSYYDVIEVLKIWKPQDSMVQEFQDYQSYLPKYGKRF